MVESLSIERFLALAREIQAPVLDVRTPAEYAHAHLPEAKNLPLFSNEERIIVGTAYKQQGRETAIKLGLEIVGVKMRSLVEEAERINAERISSGLVGIGNKTLFVYCWRGGMRSGSVAWLLDLMGFKVYSLRGGYKAYRKLMLETIAKPRKIVILGGKTGSGKTLLLQELAAQGEQVLDLESLANHKGSAFGALGEAPQPSQEDFENCIGAALWGMNAEQRVWIESESRMVGKRSIPAPLWEQMRTAPTLVLEIPLEERLRLLAAQYGGYSREELCDAVLHIEKRLGATATKEALAALEAGNYAECAAITLRYYDSSYAKGLSRREPSLLTTIQPFAGSSSVDEPFQHILLSAVKKVIVSLGRE